MRSRCSNEPNRRPARLCASGAILKISRFRDANGGWWSKPNKRIAVRSKSRASADSQACTDLAERLRLLGQSTSRLLFATHADRRTGTQRLAALLSAFEI